MEPNVAFRVAANSSIGGGHVVRSVSLANALTAAGASCAFFVNAEAAATAPILTRSVHRCIAVPADSAAALAVARDHGPFDWLVVDDYSLTAADETPWRAIAAKIAVVDDLANRSHDCDLLVDSTPTRSSGDYNRLAPPGARLLLGPSYAPLRDEFSLGRPSALSLRAKTDVPRRLLVSFGLADPGGITGQAVAALGAAMPDLVMDVVVGPLAQDHAALTRPNVTLHRDPSSMARLMADADIAIGAGGSTAWERACLGLPAIAVILADNQRALARGLEARGALFAFEKGDWPGVITALRNLACAQSVWRGMSAGAARACDGLGAHRFALELAPPLSAPGLAVRLRPAAPEDEAAILVWQTAGVRAYSSNPEPPTAAEHKAWMTRKLADPSCIFNIVEEAGIPLGVLRLDQRKDGSYIVSILISDAAQGRGIGLAALRAGARLMHGHVLWAKIDDRNIASLRLFQKAGFLCQEPTLYRRMPGP